MLLLDDWDEKTGEIVLDVLQSKHPDARVSKASVMEEHDALPGLAETRESHQGGTQHAVCLLCTGKRTALCSAFFHGQWDGALGTRVL